MKQIDIREGALRQHRMISLFAVIQCWLRTLDGLAFDRVDLERLLGLERFKRQRIKWLQDDLKDFFPYQETYWYTGDSFAALYISRVPLKKFLPIGRMSDSERISRIPKDGPKIGLFEMWTPGVSKTAEKILKRLLPYFTDAANYDERVMSSYLSLLSQGLITPDSLPFSKIKK